MSSSGVDVYTTISMAAGALYGPKHGGANEAVIRMLEAIGSKDNVQRFILEVKQKKKVLFGFGHRVYKNYDPRAKIVKKIAFEIFDILGR
jgi:citrate synthase